MPFSNFPRIEDHGVLFNNRSAVLVSKDGEIDWGCLPNFDSDPVFLSLLDREVGGYFTIAPAEKNYTSMQRYVEDTNVLITEFFYGERLALRLLDFLPMSDQPQAFLAEIHRRVECFKDGIDVNVEFFPFNRKKKVEITEFPDNGLLVKNDNRTQAISCDVKLEKVEGGCKGVFKMSSGDVKWFVTANSIKESHHVSTFDSAKRLNETTLFWRSWLSKANYKGPFSDWVNRSLLVLKGMFFDPTHFMVAAPTASLPEVIGGKENWDYRFVWLRDTAYVIDALAGVGHTKEAMRFFYSMFNRIRGDKWQINSVYPVSNPQALEERDLDLYGYMGSKPVRFGNKAAEQFQLDQYGSLINAVSVVHRHGEPITQEILELVKSIAHKIMEKWQEPDRSIWEIREEDRQYVYSKLTAWEALKNATYLLSNVEKPDEINRILNSADEIKKAIQEKGKDKTSKFYVQYFGADKVDCALLRLPLIGFCSPNDPIFINTIKEIEKRLMYGDFLFKRYEIDGGKSLSDNGFLIASFWYLEDLALMGHVTRAREGLAKLMSMFNGLKLLPEELDLKDKRYLGNYPQALSHVGLLSAIIRLSKNVQNTKDFLI